MTEPVCYLHLGSGTNDKCGACALFLVPYLREALTQARAENEKLKFWGEADNRGFKALEKKIAQSQSETLRLQGALESWRDLPCHHSCAKCFGDHLSAQSKALEALSHPASPQEGEAKCQVGCMMYYGGEIRHHKDCRFYSGSFSEMYDKLLSPTPSTPVREAQPGPVDDTSAERVAETEKQQQVGEMGIAELALEYIEALAALKKVREGT